MHCVVMLQKYNNQYVFLVLTAFCVEYIIIIIIILKTYKIINKHNDPHLLYLDVWTYYYGSCVS
jgi:hypothetical protein